MKANPVRALEHVATRDRHLMATHILVNNRLVLADGAGSRVQHKVAIGIELQAIGPLEAECDL